MNHPIFDHPLCTSRLTNAIRNFYWKNYSGDIHDIKCHVPKDAASVRHDVITGALSPKRVTGYGYRSHAILCKILEISPAQLKINRQTTHPPTPCCNYTANPSLPYPVFWNPYNKVVQCHNCGHTYIPQPFTI